MVKLPAGVSAMLPPEAGLNDGSVFVAIGGGAAALSHAASTRQSAAIQGAFLNGDSLRDWRDS